MRCTLDGGNARIISKGFQSLSKFGADLFIEADQNAFKLRALNATRTAVGTISFSRHFFEIFSIAQGSEFYCKISMKACLAVFRNMKQVEKCEFSIDATQQKFHVQLKCRYETVKNAIIPIIDDENITAAQSANDSVNSVSASHKIFTEISSHFNTAEEEITLEAQKDKLAVMNYIEGSRLNDKFMRSKLKLTPAEFEGYHIAQDATVTFCLKEFRAFLLFAEVLNENLLLNFSDAGCPVFLKMNKMDQIECVLIMSTLSPEDISYYDDHVQENSDVQNIANISTTATQKRTIPSPNVCSSKRVLTEDTTLSNDSALFAFVETEEISNNAEVARHAESGSNNECVINLNVVRNVSRSQSEEYSLIFRDTEENIDAPQNADDDEPDDMIPQSPQRSSQRLPLRSIFSRCFESTYVPKEPSPNSNVYVPDSDTEDYTL